MKKKKTPMRMCVGCREMKPKKELIRIVKNKENEISVDFTGKKPGRGAYICNDVDCLKKVKKAGKLEKTFGMNISDDIYVTLNKRLEERIISEK